MQQRKLLIASANEGKIKEMRAYLEHLPFDIITLADIDMADLQEPEETADTLDGNALIKAKYYAEKTGYMSIADDTGLFVDALSGWPGVKSARVADTDEARRVLLLKKLENETNRRAEFRNAVVCFDPDNNHTYTVLGIREGEILTEEQFGEQNWAYNPLFFLPDLQKSYAELTIAEKNEISHRGKALQEMKYVLTNQYAAKHIVVPYSLVIREGKVLMILRNDPHRPEYHKKWEFPGGSMEFGESMEENVVRETLEETGFETEVISKLSYISVEHQSYPTFAYQIYLVPFVCKITGGEAQLNDMETLDIHWFDIDDVLNHDLVGENARMYEKLLQELKKCIQTNNL